MPVFHPHGPGSLNDLLKEMQTQQSDAVEAACRKAQQMEPECGVLVIEHDDGSISVFVAPSVPAFEIWRGPESAFDFSQDWPDARVPHIIGGESL